MALKRAIRVRALVEDIVHATEIGISARELAHPPDEPPGSYADLTFQLIVV